MFKKTSLIILVVSFLLTGCTTSTVTSVSNDGGNVFALPAEVVDRMLMDAMSAEISGGGISRGSTVYPSYIGTVSMGALDTDTITASAKPAKGRRADGEIISGYVFEVQRHGSAPVRGAPAANRIHAKLQADAERTGTGAVFIEFSQ